MLDAGGCHGIREKHLQSDREREHRQHNHHPKRPAPKCAAGASILVIMMLHIDAHERTRSTRSTSENIRTIHPCQSRVCVWGCFFSRLGVWMECSVVVSEHKKTHTHTMLALSDSNVFVAIGFRLRKCLQCKKKRKQYDKLTERSADAMRSKWAHETLIECS